MSNFLGQARDTLHEVFGFADFRPGQAEIVEAIGAGRDVLAILPTGSGKSLCYQLPSLVRNDVTIVVSPLIALMRDQVMALRDLGVAAASLNSANDFGEIRDTTERLLQGEIRLLYISPERLVRADTLGLLRSSRATMLAIDEAHCVSQWGHDFRPEYREIGRIRRELGNIQLAAFTATADAATRADIAAQLFPAPPQIFIGGFDRPNIRLAMQPKNTPARQLLAFLDSHRGESGIVYCLSRKRTEEFADLLNAEGYRAVPYHAKMDKAQREANQDLFVREEGLIVTATVAFGMGIDKPDVRFVCHVDLPKNIESYYQEIGRAGRDSLPADTLCLYGFDDIRIRRQQIEESDAGEEQKRTERQRLNALIALCEAPRCRRQTLLAYFGEQTPPCGNCDLCQGGARTFDGTIEAQKALSAIIRTGQRFGVEHLVAVVIGDNTDAIQRFGHDRLPTFGVGKDRPKAEWRTLFRQLLGLGLANVEIAEHGRWVVTDDGWEVLRGKRKVEMRLDVVVRRERRSRKHSDDSATPTTTGLDSAESVKLLSRLKSWRTALSRARGVPAYMIFSDRTLIEIAQQRPQSEHQLARIHGVGKAKLEAYAAALLETVAASGRSEASSG